MTLPTSRSDREKQKFIEREDGQVAVAVDIETSDKAAGGSLAAGYSSPIDFTATYTDTGSITLSGLPFSITDASQISFVKVLNTSTNLSTLYTSGASNISFGYSAGVLTIYSNGVKITSLTSNDVYSVGINSQIKAYDSGLDVTKIIDQSPLYDHYTDAVEIVSEQDLTAAYADFGGEIDTRTYTKIGVWVIADCNSSEDVDLKVLGKHESVGTDEYEIDGVSVKTLWSGSGTDFKKYYEFEVGGVPYIQLQAIAGTVGATAGDLTISITKVY